MATKRQLLDQMFEEIGIAGYAFNLTPDEQMSALRRLDSLMAQWDGKGIRIGYALPSSMQASDPDQDSGIPDTAIAAVVLNGAVRLAPMYGKTLQLETIREAKVAYLDLLSRSMTTPQVQLQGNLPRGAGNKPWRRRQPFVTPPQDPITVGPDSTLDLNP